MARGLAAFDRSRLGGSASLIGIDEAGRGALAGPVVACAVRCAGVFYGDRGCGAHVRGVDDSKRLKPESRAALVRRFAHPRYEKWIQVGTGTASVAEIEQHNILQATVLAMRRAVEALGVCLDYELERAIEMPDAPVILIDGRPLRQFPLPHEGVVRGDSRSFAIALAGIHAKEHRDSLMRHLGRSYPDYGFVRHKGYGTPEHIAALRARGPSPEHRAGFLGFLREETRPRSMARQRSLFAEDLSF